jgi:hypothetical protein
LPERFDHGLAAGLDDLGSSSGGRGDHGRGLRRNLDQAPAAAERQAQDGATGGLLGEAHARGVRHGLFCFSALGLVSRRLACPLLGRQGRRRRRSGGCGVRLAGRLMRGLVVRAGVVMIGGVPVSLSRLVVVLGGPGVMLRVRMMMMLACQFLLSLV